jgi:hypothetical protein
MTYLQLNKQLQEKIIASSQKTAKQGQKQMMMVRG